MQLASLFQFVRARAANAVTTVNPVAAARDEVVGEITTNGSHIMQRWAICALFSVLSLFAAIRAEACPPLPDTLTNGTTADATQVMADLESILSCPLFTGAVGIGTTSPTGQLDVYAPSTNTSSNSYGIYLSGAQSTANTTGDYGEYIAPTYSAASGNTLAIFDGIRSVPENTSSGTVTTMRGVFGYPQNTSTGSVTSMIGVEGLPVNTSTATTGAVTNMYGVQGVPAENGGGTVTNMYGVFANPNIGSASSGVVTNMFGLYSLCQNNSTSGASATNCYGLYLASPTSSISNIYGVYQAYASATNYFAGDVGIGLSNPTYTLQVQGTAYSSGGWSSPSDGRLKDRIATIPDALSTIERLRGVEFYWRPPADRSVGKTLALPLGEQQVGFVAQEVEKVVPEAVSKPATGSDGAYGVNEAKIVAILVEAIKEQQTEIDELKAEIAASKK
jgi:hypothetical protein